VSLSRASARPWLEPRAAAALALALEKTSSKGRSQALRHSLPAADDGFVAIASRPTLLPARSAPLPATRVLRRVAVALLAALSLALLFAAAPASARVVEIGPTSVGLQPHFAKEFLEGEFGASFNNASGHPVLHGSRVYLIYWDPTAHYHGDWQHLIDQFLANVAAASGSLGSVFAVNEQYTDSSNQPANSNVTFRGAYTDTKGYPAVGCEDPKPLGPKDRITCLNDQQIREELASFIAEHGLQKGMGTIFYVLTPPGVTVCVGAGGAKGHCSDFSGKEGEESYGNSFCSYHSAVSPTNPTNGDGNTLLYAAIPWTAGGWGDPDLEAGDRVSGEDCQNGGALAPQQEPNQVCPGPDGGCDTGLADLIINQIAVEQQNIVTNPLLNAWQDNVNRESTDECRNYFLPKLGGDIARKLGTESGTLYNQQLANGIYYLNDAFNAASYRVPYPAVPCVIGVSLVPQFTSPSAVNAGDIVAFNGMESNITLNGALGFPPGAPQNNFATYTWDFGDGAPPVSGYAPGAPGCTVPWLSPCAASALHAYTYGGTYFVTLQVTDVANHKASVTHPVTVIGPAPPPPAGAGAAGAGKAGAGAAGPPPAAAVRILSRSLRAALRSGLVIDYTVNERVTGRFEVLLSKSVAHKIHLRAPAATGLPTGTPAQVVIGKSILVTLGGGHAKMTIQLSKSVTAKLERLRSVSLLLRLVARNAAGGTATSLTPIKLSH
jgi:hypothetical protein